MVHHFPDPREPLRVLGYATNGVADELALAMLAHLVDDLPVDVEIAEKRLQASELLSLVHAQGFSVVCLADLPPSPSSKARYLKRLRAELPELRIVVGRWGPSALHDESTQVLRDAGANLVASTLLETRTYLAGLVEIPRIPVPEIKRHARCVSKLDIVQLTKSWSHRLHPTDRDQGRHYEHDAFGGCETLAN